MKLSDWDVLSVDELSRPSNGTSSVSPAGLRVDVRNRTVEITSGSHWSATGGFTKPIIGEMTEGRLQLHDIYIIAYRDECDRLLWCTWFWDTAELQMTCGIVVNGWDEHPPSVPGGKNTFLWTGVRPHDVEVLKDWLEAKASNNDVPSQAGQLAFGNALRFNQGDRFIARGGQFPCPATLIGASCLPLIYAGQPEQVKRDMLAATAVTPATTPACDNKEAQAGV